MGAAKTLSSDDVQQLRQTPQIRKIMGALDEPRYTVDLSLIDELREYMETLQRHQDQSGASFRTQDDLQRLAAQLAEVQRLRSRVMVIKFEHGWARKSLRRLYEVAGAILRTGPVGGLANQSARDGAVTWVLHELRSRLDQFDLIVETADEAERHLGNSYFTVRELIAVNTNYLEHCRHDRGS